ncbi:polyprenyl synthetase family protein [Anaerococcus sp.]|uniref:polyprenyl synthetase family protein n=1 Tax=Anaerococcus sp. TaxID=1872515 RepID=UPI0027B8C8A3|nr:polyprenyl synthetase family protein [Anaerococcus sp.]MDU2583781.1 polyprenyl synthetase family protein [Anaerococcus prevotii]
MNNTIYEKYENRLAYNKTIIDEEMAKYFSEDSIINEAMLYAADSGKRIRASLFLETRRLHTNEISKNDLLFALAIEMIQAYSLVHDDLPAMDDDDYRRGKESVHKHFGEDLAILTGDALLNEASMIMMNISLDDPYYLKAASYLMKRVGKNGMIKGQILDLRRRKSYDEDFLVEVYDKKTADFFKGAIVAAGLVNGFDDEIINKLERYSYYLGLGFQIQDDLLEEEFKDEINILNLRDLDSSKKFLAEINGKCKKEIEDLENNDFLLFLIEFLTNRKY